MTIPHLDAFRATVLTVWNEDSAPTAKPEPERSARQHAEVIAAGWYCPSWGRYNYPRRRLGPCSLTTARAVVRVRADGRWPPRRLSNRDMLWTIATVFDNAPRSETP